MEHRKLFDITYNSDQTEGRGHSISLGLITDKAEAIKAVDDPRYKRYCVMGVHNPGREEYNISERNFYIFDTAEEFWEHHSEEGQRQAALAKLTDKEQRLLGLK